MGPSSRVKMNPSPSLSNMAKASLNTTRFAYTNSRDFKIELHFQVVINVFKYEILHVLHVDCILNDLLATVSGLTPSTWKI